MCVGPLVEDGLWPRAPGGFVEVRWRVGQGVARGEGRQDEERAGRRKHLEDLTGRSG